MSKLSLVGSNRGARTWRTDFCIIKICKNESVYSLNSSRFIMKVIQWNFVRISL